jgi:hypothetical protein
MNAKSQLAMNEYNRIMGKPDAQNDYRRLARVVNTEFTGSSEKPFYMDISLGEHEASRAMNCAIDAAMAICGHTAFNERAALLFAFLPLHSDDAIMALERWLGNFRRAWW